MEANTQNATPSNEVAQLIAEAQAYAASFSEALGQQNTQLLDLYSELIDQTLDAMVELYDLLVEGDEEEGAAILDIQENILAPLHQKVEEVSQAMTIQPAEKPEMAPANTDGSALVNTYRQMVIAGLQNDMTAHRQFQAVLQATSIQTINTILSLVPAAISNRIARPDEE